MFIFKEINSNDMGVYVREENFLGKAPLKYDEIEVDGRDGTEIVPLGYRNFTGTLNDVVITKNNYNEVLSWLSGTGELIYMNKKTRIHFLDTYQVAKHKQTFSIPFIRDPFWYQINDDYIQITPVANNFEIYNNGNVRSKPIMKITKNSDSVCEIEVNDVYLKYDFKQDDYVIIDCEKMEASYDNLTRNRNLEIGFKFPVLRLGSNIVKIIDGDAKIEFKRKDAWL